MVFDDMVFGRTGWIPIGSNLAKEINSKDNFAEYLNESLPNSIVFESILPFEIEKIIDSLQVEKASGDDGISPHLVKENEQYLESHQC